MHTKLKSLIGDLVPPLVLRRAQVVITSGRRSLLQHIEQTGEKGAEWYDESFDASRDWLRHYTESEYYFLWSVIADRIQTAGTKSILEIGCGTGQFAALIRDKIGCKYVGFDFSHKRVNSARRAHPDLSFIQQDAFETDLFTACDYDTVVCTEFLEHVERDTVVLGKIRKGTWFYGTVPNFPFTSHVRHFNDENAVRLRYETYFKRLRIDRFVADPRGKAFYLLDGGIA